MSAPAGDRRFKTGMGINANSKAKREHFCREYVIDRNGTRAATAAGFAPKSANRTAYLLLNEPAIQKRIAELTKKQLDKADITAERVFMELGRLAFADVRDLYDEKGDLVPIHTLADDAAASIAGVEVTVESGGRGKKQTRTHKIRRTDKIAALNVLARHFKIVGAEVDESLSAANAIAERMERAAERLRRMRPVK